MGRSYIKLCRRKGQLIYGILGNIKCDLQLHSCMQCSMLFDAQGGGGITLIFSCIRRLLNFNIFVGFQKNKYFFGVWRFWGYFSGVITKLDYVNGSFLCILGSFLKVKVQNWGIFGLLKFQIFFGCLKCLIFWGVKGRCWARAYVCMKISEYPPPWGLMIMVQVWIFVISVFFFNIWTSRTFM